MFIFDERDKILQRALKVFLSRNVNITKLFSLEKNKVGLLPRKSNGQYLPEMQAWLKVREEDIINRYKPYLFFDPISGWMLSANDFRRLYPKGSSFKITKPPQELLDVLTVLQYYCGIPYGYIKKLNLEDYSISSRTLTVRNFTKKDPKYFVGFSDIVRSREGKLLKIKLTRPLGDILKKWIYFRGGFAGRLLWTPSTIYQRSNIENIDNYTNWLFTFFPKPANSMSLLDASVFLKCHLDTLYKRLRSLNSKHAVFMYRNSTLLLLKETSEFPKFFGDF